MLNAAASSFQKEQAHKLAGKVQTLVARDGQRRQLRRRLQAFFQ
jgi:hypothetical protein